MEGLRIKLQLPSLPGQLPQAPAYPGKFPQKTQLHQVLPALLWALVGTLWDQGALPVSTWCQRSVHRSLGPVDSLPGGWCWEFFLCTGHPTVVGRSWLRGLLFLCAPGWVHLRMKKPWIGNSGGPLAHLLEVVWRSVMMPVKNCATSATKMVQLLSFGSIAVWCS